MLIQLFFGKMKSVKSYRKQPSAGNVLPCQEWLYLFLMGNQLIKHKARRRYHQWQRWWWFSRKRQEVLAVCEAPETRCTGCSSTEERRQAGWQSCRKGKHPKQSVSVGFSSRNPLSLKTLCTRAANFIKPDGMPSDIPQMPPVDITEEGVQRRLQTLNPHKAAGPDKLNPLVLREIADVIALLSPGYTEHL